MARNAQGKIYDPQPMRASQLAWANPFRLIRLFEVEFEDKIEVITSRDSSLIGRVGVVRGLSYTGYGDFYRWFPPLFIDLEDENGLFTINVGSGDDFYVYSKHAIPQSA
jgi:hypothetical protein